MKYLFIFLLFIYFSLEIYAQTSQCDPCSEINEPPVEVIYGSYGYCNFRITYEYKECGVAPNIDRHMKLLDIEFLGDCIFTDGTELMVELATKLVLNRAYTVFNSLDDSSPNKEVVFEMPCCWETIPNASGDEISPCTPTTCNCCGLFDLRRNYDSTTSEYKTIVYQRTNLNPTASSGQCGQGCVFACNIIDNITPGTPLPPHYESNNIDPTSDFNCTSYCDHSNKGYQIRTFPISPSCDVEAKFLNVQCLDGSTTIKLISIDYYNAGACNIYDAGKLAAMVMSSVIENNILTLTPGEHKFLLPSCWRFTDGLQNRVIPCLNDVCCEYYIEYDENCNRTLPTNYTVNGVFDCYGNSNNSLPTECENACKYLDEILYFED